MIPEEHGGLGLGVLEYCLMAEELARGWLSVASLLALGNGMGGEFSDQQRKERLPLFARTADKDPAKPHRGISAFLVGKPRGSFPEGLSGNKIRKIGYYGWSTWDLSFDGLRPPASAMLGAEGRGFYLALSGLEVGRAHTAARAIGLAQAAFDDAVDYAHTRHQFGGPLTQFQDVRFKLARMAAAATARPRWPSTSPAKWPSG